MIESGWLTVTEEAQILGCTRSAVHRLCGRGTLASSWFAGRRIIRESVLDRLLADSSFLARRRVYASVNCENTAVRRGS